MHRDRENIPPARVEFGSPLQKQRTSFSNANSLKDRERIITAQRSKLADMRAGQLEFFDARLLELNEKQALVDEKVAQLRELEATIKEREEWVGNQLLRVEVDKAEIKGIRDLLKAESAAVQQTSADMKAQIKRYERLFKLWAVEANPTTKPLKTIPFPNRGNGNSEYA